MLWSRPAFFLVYHYDLSKPNTVLWTSHFVHEAILISFAFSMGENFCCTRLSFDGCCNVCNLNLCLYINPFFTPFFSLSDVLLSLFFILSFRSIQNWDFYNQSGSGKSWQCSGQNSYLCDKCETGVFWHELFIAPRAERVSANCSEWQKAFHTCRIQCFTLAGAGATRE